MFAKLSAPGGVYFAYGNIDPPQWVHRILNDLDIAILENDLQTISLGDREVTIAATEWNYHSTAARQLIEQLNDDRDQQGVRILIAHTPDILHALPRNSRIDLIISGHTHGGQIVMPWLGPMMTASHVRREIAAGGLHTHLGNRIYVSRGVGWERGQAPRIRFLCPPEISLLTVK